VSVVSVSITRKTETLLRRCIAFPDLGYALSRSYAHSKREIALTGNLSRFGVAAAATKPDVLVTPLVGAGDVS